MPGLFGRVFRCTAHKVFFGERQGLDFNQSFKELALKLSAMYFLNVKWSISMWPRSSCAILCRWGGAMMYRVSCFDFHLMAFLSWFSIRITHHEADLI